VSAPAPDVITAATRLESTVRTLAIGYGSTPSVIVAVADATPRRSGMYPLRLECVDWSQSVERASRRAYTARTSLLPRRDQDTSEQLVAHSRWVLEHARAGHVSAEELRAMDDSLSALVRSGRSLIEERRRLEHVGAVCPSCGEVRTDEGQHALVSPVRSSVPTGEAIAAASVRVKCRRCGVSWSGLGAVVAGFGFDLASIPA